jgi:hypothetical protein
LLTTIMMGLMIVNGCDQNPASGLKGQVNTTVTFHGLTIDQDGRPLSGVKIEYQVDAYPKDWTFETRGRAYETSIVTATSDPNGRFEFTATGSSLRRMNVVPPRGSRHFYETDIGSRIPTTYGYQLIAWGDLWYKSDPNNPAVFVFVKDGTREVSALPSRGGSESGGGKNWRVNQPAWPKKPSLKDVVRKQPTSNPEKTGNETGQTNGTALK